MAAKLLWPPKMKGHDAFVGCVFVPRCASPEQYLVADGRRERKKENEHEHEKGGLEGRGKSEKHYSRHINCCRIAEIGVRGAVAVEQATAGS